VTSEGKIRYLGLSEASAQTLRRACKVHHIAAHQIEYSPFALDFEADVIPVARELGIATVAYSPIGRGFLTGQIKKPEDLPIFHQNVPRFAADNFPKIMTLVSKFEEVAKAHGKSPAQICLAWLLAQGDDIVPIPGTRGQKYLDENTSAGEIKLSSEDLKALREAADATKLSGTRYPEVWSKELMGETPEL
jgi:aryl-alcohol dehydrogenase-like predicted oxidoreductase